MITAHGGTVELQHSFEKVCAWLDQRGPTALQTSKGTCFEATVTSTTRGRHKGEEAVRFFQQGEEYARAYACCWGHYYNCNRTRIGMYCAALDASIGSLQ